MAKIFIWLLSGSLLFSAWLPVFAFQQGGTESVLAEALRTVVGICVTLLTLISGMIWRDWRNRLRILEGRSQRMDDKQDVLIKMVGLMAVEMRFQNPKHELLLNQYLYTDLPEIDRRPR